MKVPCVCSVVHVRTCRRCCATLRATAPCIHMPTQGHSATGYTRAYDSVRVVSRSVRCRACVHCALSTGVCMRSVGTLFRARGIDATVGAQRSASTALDAGCTRLRPRPRGRWPVEGGGEVKVPCVCSVVHVRTCWRCCATLRATAPCIHMPTQGHSATGYTRAYDSVRVVSRSVRCRACVHCALSAGVCMRSVGTLFRARGIDATVGVQRSASTAPVPKGTPPRCLARTLHAPALVPPVVDHLPCRGGVSLRSRSACAAQQGRPAPSFPEERTNCEGRKNSAVGCHFQSGPKLRVRALSAPTAVPESTRRMC